MRNGSPEWRAMLAAESAASDELTLASVERSLGMLAQFAVDLGMLRERAKAGGNHDGAIAALEDAIKTTTASVMNTTGFAFRALRTRDAA